MKTDKCLECKLFVPVVECPTCKGRICLRCARKHWDKHRFDVTMAKAAMKDDPILNPEKKP